jgi:hypothetical protein
MDSLDARPLYLPSDSSSKLRQLLFRDSYRIESRSEIVGWWERRRLAYNAAVGTTGLVSLAFLHGLGAIGPRFDHGDIGPPLMAVVGYAVLANIFYTSGWIAELMLRPLLGRQTGTVGATLFRYGTAFSVTLTAMPIGIAFLDFGIRMIKWVF